MSDSVVFSRRDFLKLVGVGVAGAAAGCAKPPADKLYPYLVAPDDILPGVPYFYASTCRECPVVCGVVVRAREGRAIKIAGNTHDPIGQCGLCGVGCLLLGSSGVVARTARFVHAAGVHGRGAR